MVKQATVFLASSLIEEELSLQDPIFNKIIKKSKKNFFKTTNIQALLNQYFQIQQSHDFPLAAWLAQKHQLPGCAQGTWMLLRPVELKNDLSGVYMLGPRHLNVSPMEFEQIHELFSPHFNADGFSCYRIDSQIFLLHSQKKIELNSVLSDEITGKEIGCFLPAGQDQSLWRRYLTEWQLMLHSHPINQERQKKAFPLINSLWLEYIGSDQEIINPGCDVVISDDPIFEALADQLQVPFYEYSKISYLSTYPSIQYPFVFLTYLNQPNQDYFWQNFIQKASGIQIYSYQNGYTYQNFLAKVKQLLMLSK